MTGRVIAVSALVVTLLLMSAVSAGASRFSTFKLPKGLQAEDITLGAGGNMWIAATTASRKTNSELKVVRLGQDGDTKVFATGTKAYGASIAPDLAGGIVIGWAWEKIKNNGSYQYGGLGRVSSEGRFTDLTNVAQSGQPLEHFAILAIAPEQADGIWYGSYLGGVGRFGLNSSGSDAYVDNSRTNNQASEVAVDSRGTKWVIQSYSTEDGLRLRAKATIGTVFRRPSGIGFKASRRTNKRWSLHDLIVDRSDNLRFFITKHAYKDGVQLNSLGTWLARFHPDRGLQRINVSRVEPHNSELVEGPDRSMWWLSTDGLVRLRDNGKTKLFKFPDGLGSARFSVGPDGRSLWIAPWESRRIIRFAVPGTK